MNLILAIFGISATVNRPLYQAVGFGLMLFKYAVETVFIYMFTGLFYTPLAFAIPSVQLRSPYFQQDTDWLVLLIVLWSIPFLWIAVTMSIRRSVDAGFSPIFGLLVVLPIVNILVMLRLAFQPSKQLPANENTDQQRSKKDAAYLRDKTKMVYSALLGVVVGGLSALVSTLISVYTMHNYGSSLFVGMPIIAGAVAGFIYNQPLRGIGGSMAVGTLSVLVGGTALLLFAFEGVICLVMAFPILVPVGALGGLIGWFLAKMIVLQSHWLLMQSAAAMLLLCWVESHFSNYSIDRVESSVVVNAPIETVWNNVVEFPEIQSQADWWFRLGIATPLRATITGNGVGAIRRCEFTTGAFVEPITEWNPPHRLAFDVTEQPDPLVEMTPYHSIHPPHLQHSFHSVQGEFELVKLGPKSTRLIGRTWYVVEMRPSAYWKLWTDEIVHRIHLRVLEHIRLHSESNAPDVRTAITNRISPQ